MRKESTLPLCIRGYEANTARDVYQLTEELGTELEQLLRALGFVYVSDIRLMDGQLVDGWVRL